MRYIFMKSKTGTFIVNRHETNTQNIEIYIRLFVYVWRDLRIKSRGWGKVLGGAFTPPQPARGSGERRKLPQRPKTSFEDLERA